MPGADGLPSAWATVVPARSEVARAVSRGSLPVKTPLPIMLGVKRLPSSLNQFTTARLKTGTSSPASAAAAARTTAWAAARTPYGAVVPSSQRLRVQVRAEQDPGGAGNELGQPELVARRVHGLGEPVVRQPGAEPGTGGVVFGCSCLAVNTAARRGAEAGHDGEIRQETGVAGAHRESSAVLGKEGKSGCA